MGDSERELDVVRVLQSLGFVMDYVRRGGGRSNSMHLWSPRLGFFVTSLIEGRKEMLKMFQRKKYREIKESRLFECKLRKSRLGIKYHLRDLIGLGLLDEKSTPVGKFFRLIATSV